LLIAFLFFVGCTAMACKSYTAGLQQSVTRVDETAAITALHTISVAQRTYSATSGGDYGTFEQLIKGGYLDSRFGGDQPKMKGYVLSMAVTPPGGGSPEGSYRVNADPEAPQSGRHFYMDSASELIHVNASQPAGAGDQSLEQ
jgi:hypothetical protein